MLAADLYRYTDLAEGTVCTLTDSRHLLSMLRSDTDSVVTMDIDSIVAMDIDSE